MRLILLSDLHIEDSEDPWYDLLLKWIEKNRSPDTLLVFAGDIFHFIMGDKPVFIKRYESFFSALKMSTDAGTQIHYIEGNHDFLLNRALNRNCGVQVHTDEANLQLGGKKFYIAHGDFVDRTDITYLMMRAALRSPLTHLLYPLLRGQWIDQLGRRFNSYRADQRSNHNFDSSEKERIRLCFRNFAVARISEGFDFVIMGHTHDPDEMRFKVGEHEGQYINIGNPRELRSCLMWDENSQWIRREPL